YFKKTNASSKEFGDHNSFSCSFAGPLFHLFFIYPRLQCHQQFLVSILRSWHCILFASTHACQDWISSISQQAAVYKTGRAGRSVAVKLPACTTHHG